MHRCNVADLQRWCRGDCDCAGAKSVLRCSSNAATEVGRGGADAATTDRVQVQRRCRYGIWRYK